MKEDGDSWHLYNEWATIIVMRQSTFFNLVCETLGSLNSRFRDDCTAIYLFITLCTYWKSNRSYVVFVLLALQSPMLCIIILLTCITLLVACNVCRVDRLLTVCIIIVYRSSVTNCRETKGSLISPTKKRERHYLRCR